MTNTWNLVTWSTTIGLSLIATQIDIDLVIFILLFFSFTHWVIMYQYFKNKELPFDYMDFISYIFVALASGGVFTGLGLMSGVWEYFIYVCCALGSISWIVGLQEAFAWISKKFTWKAVYLFKKD